MQDERKSAQRIAREHRSSDLTDLSNVRSLPTVLEAETNKSTVL
jgi:hypothetical protein